jgi:hypothetical protein
MNVNIKPVSKHHGMKANKWRGVKVPNGQFELTRQIIRRADTRDSRKDVWDQLA